MTNILDLGRTGGLTQGWNVDEKSLLRYTTEFRDSVKYRFRIREESEAVGLAKHTGAIMRCGKIIAVASGKCIHLDR